VFKTSIFLEALTAPALVKGAGVALLLSCLVQIFSFLGCLPVAVALGSNRRRFRIASNLYVWFFRAAPLLLVLLIVWNAIPQAFPSLMKASWYTPFFSAFIAMSLVTIAYLSELMRGALLALGRGQSDAAAALGLTPFKAFILVSLPQAFRIALPGLINEFINLVKLTSLAYVISLREIMAVVNESIASSFRFVEWYMAALIYYLVIVSVLMLLQSYIQRRLSQK
jgi:His/Glu/Gln/Arg/opine family amino acid ABC transporter permease subunit